jgi:predicted phosphodiesterase
MTSDFTKFNPQFQIISDIHLETPLSKSSYQKFQLELHASYLCLIGDIGLIKHAGLYIFLESLLKKTPNLTIFYVFGNHEYYEISMQMAHQKMEDFVKEMKWLYGDRLILMNRRRYDVGRKITVLGCTLWSRIVREQMLACGYRLTDFHRNRGIQGWDVENHLKEHQKDLDWLNQEIVKIEEEEPERQIIVLTHHSPTNDPRANDPRHEANEVSSGFVTDLSSEKCWTSPQVKLWAFGHTHYSCSYREEGTSKLVVANQGGYNKIELVTPPVGKVVVVEASDEAWETIFIEPKPKATKPKGSDPNSSQKLNDSVKEKTKWWRRF